MPYALVVAQEISLQELVKGQYGKYATELKVSDLPDDFSAIKISTSPNSSDPMAALGPIMTFSMMGQAGDVSFKYKLFQCCWSNGDVIRVGPLQKNFLVTYKLDMDMSDLMPSRVAAFTAGTSMPTPAAKEPRLVINLVALDSVLAVTPYPSITKKDLTTAFSKSNMAFDVPAQSDMGQSTALSNIKQISLGMIMYAGDYDDVYPYAQGTNTVRGVIAPYLKNDKLWNTGNPNGGQFVFNMGMAGTLATSIPDPANLVMFYETQPWPDGRRAVSFADGHAKWVEPKVWELMKTHLKPKGIKRVGKPLPANYTGT